VRFEINLWRLGRKPKRVPKPKGEKVEGIRISVAILIPLLILLLLGISFAYMKASSSLERRIRMNRSQKSYLSKQLSTVKEEMGEFSNELKLLSTLRGKRVLWSRKLEDLSQVMPDDLWLTDLSIKTVKTVQKKKGEAKKVVEETYLTIKGVTEFAPGKEPLDSIAKLILSLNSLDSFGQDFEPFTLVFTRLSKKKGRRTTEREIMEFELSSKLRDRRVGGVEEASK
jgi:Tfp pilus assembly protein PilN